MNEEGEEGAGRDEEEHAERVVLLVVRRAVRGAHPVDGEIRGAQKHDLQDGVVQRGKVPQQVDVAAREHKRKELLRFPRDACESVRLLRDFTIDGCEAAPATLPLVRIFMSKITREATWRRSAMMRKIFMVAATPHEARLGLHGGQLSRSNQPRGNPETGFHPPLGWT